MTKAPWFRDNSPHRRMRKGQFAAEESERQMKWRLRYDLREEARLRDAQRSRMQSILPPIDRERSARPLAVVRHMPDPRTRRIRPEDMRGGTWIDNATGKPTDPRIIEKARRRVRQFASNPVALQRALRPLWRYMRATDALDVLDYLNKQIVALDKTAKINPGAGWVLRGACAGIPDGSVNRQKTQRYRNPNLPGYETSANSCTANQAMASPLWSAWGSPIPSEHNSIDAGMLTSVDRGTYARYYTRTVTPPAGTPDFVKRSVLGSVDPNIVRSLPGVPNRWPEVSPSAEIATQPVGRVLVSADGSRVPPGLGPPTFVRLRPPRAREQQGKTFTRIQRIGLMVYNALDRASEGAELVDAVYDALPADVKARWDRPDRPGDTFGQYGLEGADWKLQALWYNWHRVDRVAAVKNILKNHFSDKAIGAIQAQLPRNVGNAHNAGEMEFAKFLDDLLTSVLGG